MTYDCIHLTIFGILLWEIIINMVILTSNFKMNTPVYILAENSTKKLNVQFNFNFVQNNLLIKYLILMSEMSKLLCMQFLSNYL